MRYFIETKNGEIREVIRWGICNDFNQANDIDSGIISNLKYWCDGHFGSEDRFGVWDVDKQLIPYRKCWQFWEENWD
jgi:hypothetical protein